MSSVLLGIRSALFLTTKSSGPGVARQTLLNFSRSYGVGPRTIPTYLDMGVRTGTQHQRRFAALGAFRQQSSSTSVPPPPPPPPPHSSDKNAKGRLYLNRITRFFTFSASSLIVLGATGVALLVVYLILNELFMPSGDTRTFNKAVKLVEKDPNAQALLDFKKGSRLKAYGEVGGDKWVRNRPAHGVRTKGKDGNDHLVMRFHVESSAGKHGTVSLEQIDTSFWKSEFAYIALDVPGAPRIYIVEPTFGTKGYIPRLNKNGGFLGLKWGPRKDE